MRFIAVIILIPLVILTMPIALLVIGYKTSLYIADGLLEKYL